MGERQAVFSALGAKWEKNEDCIVAHIWLCSKSGRSTDRSELHSQELKCFSSVVEKKCRM